MAVLITIAGALLAYFGFAIAMQRRVLYPRPLAPATTPTLPADVGVVWLGSDEDIEAWYWPPPTSARPAPALIFSHGNGELIDHWIDAFRVPREWGMGILLVEYPGYGRSGGSPTERSIREAMTSGYDHLLTRPEIDGARVIAYGRSLGGGAACLLSAERPLAALILESSFTNVRTLAAAFGLPGPLILDRFENLEAVSNFERPILVVHGERDRLIPADHGRKLAEAANTELVLLPCGHNDCPRPWPQIRHFLLEHRLLDERI